MYIPFVFSHDIHKMNTDHITIMITFIIVNNQCITVIIALVSLSLGECIALCGEPNEPSIQHHVYIFMQYVNR